MKSRKEIINSKQYSGTRVLSDSELSRLKGLMLSAFVDVEQVCKKYGLTIMLGGGSALGAVRHHGFIQ